MASSSARGFGDEPLLALEQVMWMIEAATAGQWAVPSRCSVAWIIERRLRGEHRVGRLRPAIAATAGELERRAPVIS